MKLIREPGDPQIIGPPPHWLQREVASGRLNPMRWWPRAAAPPPPPPARSQLPGQIACGIIVVTTICYVTFLLMALQERTRIRMSKRSARLCVPGYCLALLLVHTSLSLLGAECRSPLESDLLATSPVLAAYMLAPVIGFGLLFISEVVTFVFISILGPGTRYEHFRHPVMAVHATAVLFYLILYVPGSVALEDRFGRPLYPLRYFFWFVSVSSLGQSVFMLIEALPGHRTREKEMDNMLARYLLAVPVCFGTGFLSAWIMMPVPALICLALSFAGFWYQSLPSLLHDPRLPRILLTTSPPRHLVRGRCWSAPVARQLLTLTLTTVSPRR